MKGNQMVCQGIVSLYDWPGKKRSEGWGPPSPRSFPHAGCRGGCGRLIAPFGYEPRLRDALVLLVALHDLGKISDSFRAMIQDGASQEYRHWKLSRRCSTPMMPCWPRGSAATGGSASCSMRRWQGITASLPILLLASPPNRLATRGRHWHRSARGWNRRAR